MPSRNGVRDDKWARHEKKSAHHNDGGLFLQYRETLFGIAEVVCATHFTKIERLSPFAPVRFALAFTIRIILPDSTNLHIVSANSTKIMF